MFKCLRHPFYVVYKLVLDFFTIVKEQLFKLF